MMHAGSEDSTDPQSWEEKATSRDFAMWKYCGFEPWIALAELALDGS